MKFKILAIVMLVLSSSPAFSDLQELVNETQRMEMADGRMRLVWWVPDEYWIESFKLDPSITEEQKKQFVDVLSVYTVVSIIDGEVGVFGGLTPSTYEELAKRLSLRIGKNVYALLSKDKLSPDAQNFFNMMKPAMAGMLGQFGSGIEFFAFKANDKNGNRLINVNKESKFTVVLDKSYDFRTPLGALLPKKVDPKTKEEFPGNYKYNPFTGKKLR